MPTLSTTTTLSLAAGQALVFLAGSGQGIAVADPNGRNAKYSIGPQQTAVGPFSTAVSVDVVLASGSISYRVDVSGDDQTDQTPPIAAISERMEELRISNITPTNSRKLQRMISNVRAGSGRGRILCLGDSTTAGAGAGTSTSGCAGAFQKSWPKKLASKLTARGVNASQISLTGNQGITSQVTYPAYDPRLTLGTGWSSSGIATLGGNAWLFTSGSGVGSLTLTERCTHFQVFYAAGFSVGTAGVTIDGGANLATLTAAGGYAMNSQTFDAGSLGTHTISINANNNGNFLVPGIVCWDATQTGIDIIQAAQFGANTAPFNVADGGTAPWAAKAMIAKYAPDLTIIQLGVNSVRSAIAVATYKAELKSIVQAAKAVGNVLLMDFLPDNSVASTAQDLYLDAVYEAAIEEGVMFASVNQRWGAAFPEKNALGYYYDTVHMTEVGYSAEADWITEILLSRKPS